MLRVVKKFLALDGRRKRLLAQSLLALGVTRYRLSSRGFKALTSGLTLHRSPVEPSPVDPESLEKAECIGWAVRAAARRTPWQSTCLVQVLAAQQLLNRQSIPGVFFIGVVPGNEHGDSGRLDAHAWLNCGGQFITGEQGHERYRVVSTYSWP